MNKKEYKRIPLHLSNRLKEKELFENLNTLKNLKEDMLYKIPFWLLQDLALCAIKLSHEYNYNVSIELNILSRILRKKIKESKAYTTYIFTKKEIKHQNLNKTNRKSMPYEQE